MVDWICGWSTHECGWPNALCGVLGRVNAVQVHCLVECVAHGSSHQDACVDGGSSEHQWQADVSFTVQCSLTQRKARWRWCWMSVGDSPILCGDGMEDFPVWLYHVGLWQTRGDVTVTWKCLMLPCEIGGDPGLKEWMSQWLNCPRFYSWFPIVSRSTHVGPWAPIVETSSLPRACGLISDFQAAGKGRLISMFLCQASSFSSLSYGATKGAFLMRKSNIQMLPHQELFFCIDTMLQIQNFHVLKACFFAFCIEFSKILPKITFRLCTYVRCLWGHKWISHLDLDPISKIPSRYLYVNISKQGKKIQSLQYFWLQALWIRDTEPCCSAFRIKISLVLLLISSLPSGSS